MSDSNSLLAEGIEVTLQNQDSILQSRGLSVYYDTKKVVTGVDLDVARNRITAIIGPSGCGKSTLWRVLQAAMRKLGTQRVQLYV